MPFTRYDITVDDFTYQPDRDNLQALQGTQPLPYLIDQFVTRGRERSMRSRLAREAVKVKARSRLDLLVRRCGEILALEMIPETFIVPANQINAAVFGRDEDPVLIITSAALASLNETEIMTMVGHELGHVKSKHLLYHALAESLGTGAQFLAGFYGMGLVGLPIQMLLLAWHRESEISADRAALLIVNDPGAFKSMMMKLVGLDADKRVPSDDSLSTLFQTHPTYLRRLEMIKEFNGSTQHVIAREKIRLGAKFGRTLMPFCRFCGASKPVSDSYCAMCGKSQI